MKRIAFALMLLPLTAWAGPGTGTFEEGGLRWYRDHSPAEMRHLHLDKDWGNDSSPNIWAKSEGHCAAKVKIEAPSFHPGPSVTKVLEYLVWASWLFWEERHYLMGHWKTLGFYKLDRYSWNGLTTTFEANEQYHPFPKDWVPHRGGHTSDDDAFISGDGDGSKSRERWDDLLAQFKRAMDDEEYVHYAYWEGIQSFDLDTFHSATISRTDTWGQDGRWTHKLRIKSCGGYWEETRYVDTVSWRVTDFDNALHRGIDDQFNRWDACRNKGGWETTYLVKHSDDRIMVTHRCKGKRSDGHFARGEYKLAGWQSRWLAKLLNLSVDHY